MALEKPFTTQNIVVLANNFNPSIFNQHWLITRGIFKEEEILAESVFSQDVVQVKTPTLNMLVVPQQIQFNPTNLTNWRAEIDILIKIVKELPQVPYSAVGINFTYMASHSDKATDELSRDLFFTPTIPLFKEFDKPNSKFGTYLSKDFGDSRLKLDIKPVVLLNEKTETIHFLFNFHKDIQGSEHKEVVNFLNTAAELKNEADRLMQTIS